MASKQNRQAKAAAKMRRRAHRQTSSARRSDSSTTTEDAGDTGRHGADHGWLGAPGGAPVTEPAARPRRQVVVDLDTERQALRSLVLADRLEALLEWARTGRGVTASGALRRADLAEAAALVGVQVRTLREGEELPWRGQARPGTLVTPAPMGGLGGEDLLVPVHVMGDVTVLARAWKTLVDVGALDVGATRVRVSEAGLAWLDRDGTDGVDERRSLAVAYLTRILTVDESRVAALAGLTGRVAATQLTQLLTYGPQPAYGGDPLSVIVGSLELGRLSQQGLLQATSATVSITAGLEGVVLRALHAWGEQFGEEWYHDDDAALVSGRSADS